MLCRYFDPTSTTKLVEWSMDGPDPCLTLEINHTQWHLSTSAYYSGNHCQRLFLFMWAVRDTIRTDTTRNESFVCWWVQNICTYSTFSDRCQSTVLFTYLNVMRVFFIFHFVKNCHFVTFSRLMAMGWVLLSCVCQMRDRVGLGLYKRKWMHVHVWIRVAIRIKNLG